MTRTVLDSGRLCTRCGQLKSPADFRPHPRMRDGLTSWCKSCAVARTRQWRADHRDELNARRRAAYRLRATSR
jgi:hypothetical protein